MKVVDLLYLFLYFYLKFFVFILPNSALKAFSKGIARFAYLVNSKHRKIIKANLRFCFPQKSELEITQITKEIYENFAKFGFEF